MAMVMIMMMMDDPEQYRFYPESPIHGASSVDPEISGAE
jgi:hypothetical protein